MAGGFVVINSIMNFSPISSFFASSPVINRRLYGVELVNLLYGLLTLLLIALFAADIPTPGVLALERIGVMGGIGVCYLLYQIFPSKATRLLRYVYPVTLLAYWYPDTYNFCQLFPNLDHVFAYADEWLFGFQPAIHFARTCSGFWWSEAFNLGYFAYYVMILLAVLLPLFTKPERFSRTVFVMMTCFVFYYIVYLFLPVVGPQFYFPAIGFNLADLGQFPAIGDYFRHHPELPANYGPEGPFRLLVEAMQGNGERPTAAFPSSHVGMSTVIMLLLWPLNRKVVYILFPLYVLLCGATVYIEAHYFVDIVGGFVSAILFYFIAERLWKLPYFEGEREGLNAKANS